MNEENKDLDTEKLTDSPDAPADIPLDTRPADDAVQPEQTEHPMQPQQPVTAAVEAPREMPPSARRQSSDIYVYYVEDDEPVDDRDLYSDFDSGVRNAGRSEGSPEEKKTAASPVREMQEKVIYINNVKKEASQPSHTVSIPYDELRRVSGSGDIDITTSGNLKINRVYLLNTVISMITLCTVAASIFTGYAYIHSLEQQLELYRQHTENVENEKKPPEENEASDGDSDIIEAISIIDEEKADPAVPASDIVEIENGKLLLYDSYVGYSWAPVLTGLKPHSYDRKAFRLNSQGRMEYIKDGQISSYFGIDVSSHQGDINWNAARADGVEFAILRIGVRGYGEEGNIKVDDKFLQNYDGAHGAGVDLGVYFYSQAISVDEAVEEAKFVLEQLEGRELEYPVVFDWEPVDTASAETTPRTADIMPNTLTLAAVAFCETIKDAGYEAMIYTNKKMAYIKYDMRRLADYPVWIASYSDEMTYYYDFDIWQYGYGKVDGIDGDVDLDIGMIR